MRKKLVAYGCGVLVVLLLSPFLTLFVFAVFQRLDYWSHYEEKLRGVIPQDITYSEILDSGDDLSLFLLALPFRTELAGAAIFRLTDEFLAKLQSAGIKSIGTGAFSEWHETPKPERSDNKVPQEWGLWSAEGLSPSLRDKISDALNTPGSYYAEGDIDMIVISPKDGLGAYIFADP